MISNQMADPTTVLHTPFNAHQLQQCLLYYELLSEWTQKVNLVATNLTWEHFVDRHILDCAQLATFIEAKDTSIVDFGSGAGLPGIVLAILGFRNICLIERNQKKAAFLTYVAARIGVEITIFDNDVRLYKHQAKVIVSRAVSDINTIINLTKKIRTPESMVLLLKSLRQINTEIANVNTDISFNIKTFSSINSSEGIIVKITDIKEGACP